jgi:hypothetical protein
MSERKTFLYKNRTIISGPDSTGKNTIVGYKADPKEIARIKNQWGPDNVNEPERIVNLTGYLNNDKNKRVDFASVNDLEKYQGITNAELISSIANDPNFYRTSTGSQTPNTAKVPPESGPESGSTPTNTNDPRKSQKPTPQRLTYPSDMSSKQDRIKFTAVNYQASGVTNERDAGSGNLPGTEGITNINRKVVRGGTSVFLAIQSSITDNNSVDWQGSGLNEIERRLANLSLAAMRAGNQDVTKSVERESGNIIKEVASYAPEIRVALAGQAVGIQNILGRFGQVLNPNLELLFSGPQLRPFNFTFKLSPRNDGEAKEVKDIINFFKKNMAPIREDGNIFLKAPNTFFIKYEYGENRDGEHPGLNLIKECALTNCSVDYTPLGTYMTYPDGTMVSYTLSLQFQELEPIYSGDYNGNQSIGY